MYSDLLSKETVEAKAAAKKGVPKFGASDRGARRGGQSGRQDSAARNKGRGGQVRQNWYVLNLWCLGKILVFSCIDQ
jgi:hypothetical protein